MNAFAASLLCAGALVVAAETASAQAAAGKEWFVTAAEQSPATTARTSKWTLTVNLGSGVTPTPAQSPAFKLEGGFPATLAAKPGTRPWVTGVRPLYTTLAGATEHRVHGTQLHLGSQSDVAVAGKAARVLKRTRDAIDFVVPPQPVPGWHEVAVRTGAGRTVLGRAIGVKPLIDQAVSYFQTPRTNLLAPGGALRYVGTQGDQVVWMVAIRKAAVDVQFPPYHHALALSFASMAFILPVRTVTELNGEFVLQLPRVKLRTSVYFQALALSGAPEYAPGSFTNVQRVN